MINDIHHKLQYNVFTRRRRHCYSLSIIYLIRFSLIDIVKYFIDGAVRGTEVPKGKRGDALFAFEQDPDKRVCKLNEVWKPSQT